MTADARVSVQELAKRLYRMVVRFVRVIRVPACARVCPGSPRCLFTGKLNPSSVDETAASRVRDQKPQGKQYLYIGLASLASPR